MQFAVDRKRLSFFASAVRTSCRELGCPETSSVPHRFFFILRTPIPPDLLLGELNSGSVNAAWILSTVET